MKKNSFCIFMCGLLMLSVCSCSSSGSKGTLAGNSDNSAVLVEESAHMPIKLESGIEDEVKFDIDEENSVSKVYPGDGKDFTIELSGSKGITWTLSIPGDALPGPHTITLTHMKNAVSSSLGNLTDGIKLEPQGLRFISPATLTVSGNDLESKGILLSGGGGGNGLNFSNTTRSNGTLSAKITQLDPEFTQMVDDKVKDVLSNMAKIQEKTAEAAAKDLLAKQIQAPVPPNITLVCKKEQDEKADEQNIEKFLKEFNEPESEVLYSLLNAKKSQELLSDSTISDGSYNTEIKLLNRLMKKADLLLKTYKPMEDKYVPVTRVVIMTERSLALLGASVENSRLPAIAEWASVLSEKFLSELRDKHEYSYVSAAVKLAKDAAILGNENEGFIEKIEKALSFKLEFESTVNPESRMQYGYKITGTIPVKLTIGEASWISGSGKGEYQSLLIPKELEETPEMTATMKLPNVFDTKAYFPMFNACEDNTVDVFINNFGADHETVVVTVEDEEGSTQKEKTVNGAVKILMKRLFAEKINTEFSNLMEGGPYYKFPLELRNGQIIAAEDSFEEADNQFKIQLKIKLEHTPSK